MKTLLTTTALVALLGMAPALAAETPAMNDQPTANDVAPNQSAKPPAAQPDAAKPDAMAPSDNTAAAPAPTDNSTAATPAPADNNTAATPAPADNNTAATPAPTTDEKAAMAPASGDKFLTEQQGTEWMASSLIGSSIYNSADENLGDVNDIILNEDGSIHAVDIGVGGFLGIGEKNVAVAFNNLKKSTDQNGKDKFVLDVTKDQLDNAPAFVTLAERQRQNAAPATDQMNPAPAPAPAPAQ
jgi:sporulation protein YlmC with PRC-barrel domain